MMSSEIGTAADNILNAAPPTEEMGSLAVVLKRAIPFGRDII